MNDLHDAIRADMAMTTPVSDIRTSASIGALAEALASAQGEFTSPEKDRKVTVRTQAGQSYTFEYATLDAILKMARPILAKHKLAITSLPIVANGKMQLVTKLVHGGSGEWMECSLPLLVQGNGPQALGSAISYMRRYSITSMLCICADEDDDANAAEGNHVESRQDRPRQQPAQPRPAAARQEPPRTREGAGPAWKEMAWPVANRAGGHDDARTAEAWVNTFMRWIENIQQSQSLPAEMKPQMIASLREKHLPIFQHIEDRGDFDPVAEVASLFRKALREDEPA